MFKINIDIFFEMEERQADKNGLYPEFLRIQ